MRSVVSQHTSGYWTLHRLISATLRQTGIYCLQVWSTNVCSWLSDKTSLPQILDVQNERIFSVFCLVLFECFYKYVIPSHSSRGSKWCHSTAIIFGFGTLIFCCHSILCLSLQAVCASHPLKIRHAIFFSRSW